MATLGGFQYVTNAAATAGTISFSPYQYSQTFTVDGFGNLTAPVAKPRTNLDWLDERINEMRVKL